MSNRETPVLRGHTINGTTRLRRIVSLVTAAALSASLITYASGPANAAAATSARTASVSLTSSVNALPAGSLTNVAGYVNVSDGRFTLNTFRAEQAGVGSQAPSAESALIAGLNEVPDHGPATVHSTRDAVVDVAQADPAAAQDTTITVLPGITLTISSTGIQLSLTAQAVTEIQTWVFSGGEDIAEIVGEILDLAGVPLGSDIATIVAAAFSLGSDLLQSCTAPDGSASFTVSWSALPSCSGSSLTA